jgi:glycosyltransferase involved in cell wall biosynthesis
MNNKSIIFVRSNPVDPDPRVEKEVTSLKKAGYKIKILCWDREGKSKKFEKKEDYTIKRFKLKAPYGKFLLLPYLLIWWIYEFFLLLKEDYDIIHSCDLDTYLVALLVAKIRNKKIVYDIFDFYSDMISGSMPKLVINFVRSIDIYLIKFADAVILADESRVNQISGSKPKKIVFIYNSPEDYFKKNKFKTFKKAKNFRIFYCGLLSKERGISYILKVIRGMDLNLLIAGFGSDEKYFSQKFKFFKNIKYFGKIPYKKVIEISLSSDCLIALYSPEILNHKFASPNKLFESMMCGKPIIVSNKSTMAQIVKKEKCGLIVEYGNLDQLRKAILKIKNNPQIAKKMGENGRKAYERRYNWGIMERRLISLYSCLK